MGCGFTVIKYILCCFNFLIFAVGGTLLGLGIWIATDKNAVLTVLKAADGASEDPNVHNVTSATVLEQAAYMIIAAGAVLVILGFLGCCGAMCESKCLLALYGTCLVLILGLQVGAGIYAAVSKEEFQKDVKTLMKRALVNYRAGAEKDAVTVAWDYIFAEFECCGVEDGNDLKVSQWYEAQVIKPFAQPDSCCVLKDKERFQPENRPLCLSGVAFTNYNKGCYKSVKEYISRHMDMVIGVAIGLGGIQLVACIFAFCLCCSLDKRYK